MSNGGVETKSLELEADSWSVYSLLDSLIDRLESDIEKHSSRLREFENLRFIALSVLMFIYVAVSVIVLQIDIDRGTMSTISFIDEPISKRIFVGFILTFTGIFILVQSITRIRPSLKSIQYTRSALRIRLEFAEQMLVRISTWESKFKGDFYEKSILRLKIETLGQLVREIESIVQDGKRFTIIDIFLGRLR